MPWLECYNPEIDWKTGEVKMTRCLEECGKQWRPVQGKSGCGKTEGRRSKGGKRGKEREERKEEKLEEGEDGRS